MAHNPPSGPRVDGKDDHGRFARGNKLGRGNPLAGRAAKIRAALLKAASPADVKAIVGKLVDGAKAGDLQFIKEWLDRTIGRAVATELLERVERLEELLGARESANGNGRN